MKIATHGSRTPPAEKAMARPLLFEDSCDIIEPILPGWKPSPEGGHPRVEDREALTGILFGLEMSVPWLELRREMGCGMTRWRRLRDWLAAGTWERMHKVLLRRLLIFPGLTRIPAGTPGRKGIRSEPRE